MQIANQEQTRRQVIECPFCRQSNLHFLKNELAFCPNCGRDIWTLEAGYYGLLDLFAGEEKRRHYLSPV